ncbi:MAG: ATP-binding cassette domain-containing protein [Spirochaetes bacterium]|nr:ATP-binding cassette domain-containing protein [Spirochaetota bacterium]
MPVVLARNLSFSFSETEILSQLTFAIERGEFVSFIGPSGCGKTTLLNILSGLQKGWKGELSIDAERISLVFQHDTLLEWKNVLDNVLLPFQLKQVPLSESLTFRAIEVLDSVGLKGYEYYFPHQLSGGMKKRVEIARALITEPDLLILDEPFSSLDIITRERLNLLVKRLHSTRKTTVILVTHSVEEACFLSDRIYVLSPLPGRILDIKTIEKNLIGEGKSLNGLFVLTEAQQEVNSSIRREVQFLWETEIERPASEPATPSHTGNISGSTLLFTGKQILRYIKTHWSTLLLPFEVLLLFFLIDFLKHALAIPDLIFPAPRSILKKFVETLLNGTILHDLELTVTESLLGFWIAFALSMIVGFGIAKFKFLSRLLMPYFIGANTIPSVALAPFLVLWFGFGILPRIVTSVIVIFFPLLINIIAAFRHSEERVQCLIRFYKPGKLQSLFGMEFPAALPGIFSGVKISITLSVIGAVVGEFVSGHEGLGALVNRAKANFDIEMMFVALIWLITLGLLYYGIASLSYYWIRKRLLTPPPRLRQLSSEGG